MQCFNPVKIKTKSGYQPVRCNYCEGCKATWRTDWQDRLGISMKRCATAIFPTFTYNDQSVEYSYDINEETGEIIGKYPDIFKETLQKFHKLLRYHNKQNHKKYPQKWTQKEKPFIYVASAEHGGKTKRPHYHAIYINLHPKTIKDITEIWGKGNVKVLPVNTGSINYVIDHQIKSKDVEIHPCQTKSFILRSQGIGKEYVNIHKESHIETNRQWLLNQDKIKVGIPQYLRKKIWNEDQTDITERFKTFKELDNFEDFNQLHEGKKYSTEHKKLVLQQQKEQRENEHFEKYGETKIETDKRKLATAKKRKDFFSVGKKKI